MTLQIDLRHRHLVLPIGVTLVCRPYTVGQYQRWASVTARHQSDPMGLVTDTEATDLALDLLRESLVRLEGLTVLADDGTVREGTLEDLLLAGAGLSVLLLATVELFKSSGLSGPDLGNSNVPLTATLEG